MGPLKSEPETVGGSFDFLPQNKLKEHAATTDVFTEGWLRNAWNIQNINVESVQLRCCEQTETC